MSENNTSVENKCKCGAVARQGPKCEKCSTTYHPSCLRKLRFKETGVSGIILCCEDLELEKESLKPRTPTTANCNVSNTPFMFNEYEKEISYLKDLIRHKDSIISELRKRMSLLESIHEKYESDSHGHGQNNARKYSRPDKARPIIPTIPIDQNNDENAASSTHTYSQALQTVSNVVPTGTCTTSDSMMNENRAGNLPNQPRNKQTPGEWTEVKGKRGSRSQNTSEQNVSGNDGPQKYKHKQRKSTRVVCKGKNIMGISAIPKQGHIFIGRLDPTVTVESIKEYVTNLISNDRVECEKLNTKGPYSCFRVSTDFKHNEVLMNVDSWPDGATLDRYLFRRNK